MKKVLLLLVLTFACLFGLVACGDDPVTEPAVENEGLKNAVSYVKNLYIAQDGKATTADYIRAAQVVIEGETYTLTWTAEVTQGNATDVVVGEAAEGKVPVTINANTPTEVLYKLHVKITAPNGDNESLTFSHSIPAVQTVTIADFIAAGDVETYTALTGVITAVNGIGKADSFILTDETGSIFCYDKIEVTLGSKVTIVGLLSLYGDAKFPQLSKPAITAVHSENNDLAAICGEPLEVTAAEVQANLANVTELYAGKFLAITGYGMLNDKGYVNLKATPSDTTACINVYANSSFDLKPYVEKKITVYGFMRGSSASYLTLQLQGFEEVAEELTPEEEVSRALNAVTLNTEFTESANVDLPANNGGNVTYTWELLGTALPEFAINEGKLVVTVGEANATQKIKVTATCGTASATKEFDLKVSVSLTFTSLAEATTIGAAKEHNTYTTEKYVITGVVKSIYQTVYGNLIITDGTTEFTVYGTYINGTKYGDYTGAKFVEGDVVVLKGILGQYNGTAQMKNADLISFEPATKHETITNEAANELGAAKEHNTYTEEKYTIKGVITEIKSTTYGNMYVQDVYGNKVYVYGLYSHDGVNRYDAMTTKPVVGDFVVITGILGQYNGTAQMKNGWLLQLNTTDYVSGEDTPTEDVPTEDVPTEEPAPNPGVITTIAGALAAADGAAVELTGTVEAIDAAWSTQWNNMSIYLKDETGTILCYRLGTQVKVGDKIKVTGTKGSYNESPQIAQGATAVILEAAPEQVLPTNAVVLSFGDVANRTSWDATQQVWTANGITLTNNVASSTTPVADYSAPARFYSGTEIIVESTNAFTKAVFSVSSAKKPSSLTIEGATVTITDTTVTIEFSSAVTSFTVKLPGQLRSNDLTIYTAE